ncbi:hypothetical protein [Niabella hibiscisoli]|uniref:hypothetical protein n=1 Tax=Niabella hibiscisoli TaxID=1825928 RepID=UPI001F0FD9F3|nr:hypothetical protein [Niabella hibiscisoli]MCH5719694.1 hypothetical protein [Niabella hibiscisoli]
MDTQITLIKGRNIQASLQQLILLIIPVVLFSCHHKDDYTPPKTYVVQLQNNATLGSYLTDKDGRTLYFLLMTLRLLTPAPEAVRYYGPFLTHHLFRQQT